MEERQDLISRQDAISGKISMQRADGVELYSDEVVPVEYLRNLPSAQPERNRGKWVNNIYDIPICDQCGYMTPYDRAIDDYEYGNFCPNCGADMSCIFRK